MSDPDPYGPLGDTPRSPSPPGSRIPRDVLAGGVPHERFEERKRRERSADARLRRTTVVIRRRGEPPTPGLPSIARWQLVLIVVLVPLAAVFAVDVLDGSTPLQALTGTLVFAVVAALAAAVGIGWAAVRRRLRRRSR